MVRDAAILRTLNTLSPRAWIAILVTQVVFGFSIAVFPLQPILLVLGLVVVIPLLYAWPLLGFAVILMTVPSIGTLFQLGKLDVRPNDIGVVVGVVAVLFHWVKHRRIRIEITKMDIPLLLILGWTLTSLLWTPSFSLGLFTSIKIFAAMMIYFVIVHLIKNEEDLNKALMIWFAVGLFWAVAGTYTFYFLSIPAAEKHTIIPGTLPQLGKTVRASTFFLDPNDYGFVMSITIMVSLLFLLRTSTGAGQLFSSIGLLMMLVVIIGTFSRKSWLGLALSVMILGMKNKKIFIGVVVLGLASFGFVMWAGAGTFAEALLNRLASFFLDPDVSISERAIAWGVAKDLFFDHPIIGNGVGSFFILAPPKGSPLNIPHSFVWFLLSEFGLVGTLLFVLFVVNVVVRLVKLLGSKESVEKRLYSLILLATIPSVLFQSVFKTIGYTEPIFWVFWAFSLAFLRVHGPRGRT